MTDDLKRISISPKHYKMILDAQHRLTTLKHRPTQRDCVEMAIEEWAKRWDK